LSSLRIFLVSTLLSFSTRGTAFAAEVEKKAEGLGGLPPVSESLTGDLLRMIWGLSIVIALILVVYWLMRRKFSITGVMRNRAINVIEMQPLSGRKALAIVKVEGKKLLIGITEQQITLLSTFDSGSNFAAALKEEEQRRTGFSEEEQP
jgi:flagellar protein FliO/FliZ